MTALIDSGIYVCLSWYYCFHFCLHFGTEVFKVENIKSRDNVFYV
jgi:hypothetical protein